MLDEEEYIPEEEVRIVVKKIGEDAKVCVVKNELSSFQNIIGGLLEPVVFPEENENIDIVCDDEGKIKGQAGNLYIPHYNEAIVGNCFFVGYDDDGNWISLTDEQVEKCLNFANKYKILPNEDIYNNYYKVVDRINEIYCKNEEVLTQ